MLISYSPSLQDDDTVLLFFRISTSLHESLAESSASLLKFELFIAIRLKQVRKKENQIR